MKYNMSEETLEIYKKFQNKWVAFNKKMDTVLAWGKNVQDVMNKLKQKKQTAYEIRYILPLDKHYAP